MKIMGGLSSGKTAATMEQLNQIIRAQEKELVEMRGRAATIESTFASLQEANTRLERERNEAEAFFLRLWSVTHEHFICCKSDHRNKLAMGMGEFMDAVESLRQRGY